MAENEIPPDVTPPDITQQWDMWGPPLDGHPRDVLPPKPGTPPVSEPPPVRAYLVSPGSIQGATSQILMHTQQLVGSYTSLKDYINSTKSWIFDVSSSDYLTTPRWSTPVGDAQPFEYIPTDQHPEWTQQFTAVSDNILMQVADAVTLAGQFVDALNNAGQFYVKADKDSEQPTLSVENEH